MDAARVASSVVGSVIEASVAGGLAVALAWILCTHGRLGPRWQAVVWWAASLKLLMVLAGVPSIAVPVLPAALPSSGALTAGATADVTPPPAPSYAATEVRLTPPASTRIGTTRQAASGLIMATHALAGVWLLGVAVNFVGLCVSHRRLRRLKRRADPAGETIVEIVQRIAVRAGIRHVPRTVVSDDIRAPQTIGGLRPVIVLPASARDRWSDDDLRMALAHELAHVRRRDLLWGWVPALAESLFFFHPMARLAAREYLVAREAACDAEAIDSAQAAPHDYARLLVNLGIHRSGGALVAGGASGSRSVLTRRLEMLVAAPRNPSRPARVALAGLAALALLPLELAARQTEAPRAVTAAPVVPLRPARPVLPAAPSQPARPVTAAPAPPTRAARPVARAAQTPAPAPTEPSAPVPLPAARPVERAQQDAAALQRERDAARREAAERAREAADAAREMRTTERVLQEERAQAARTADVAREQMRRMRLEQQERMKAELDAAARDLEAARDALRAQEAPDARARQERIRGLEETASQLERVAEQRARAAREAQDAGTRADDERRRAFEEVARALEARRSATPAAGGAGGGPLQAVQQEMQALVAEQASLRVQQQALARQRQALTEQQQALDEALRRVDEQLLRVREALETVR